MVLGVRPVTNLYDSPRVQLVESSPLLVSCVRLEDSRTDDVVT